MATKNEGGFRSAIVGIGTIIAAIAGGFKACSREAGEMTPALRDLSVLARAAKPDEHSGQLPRLTPEQLAGPMPAFKRSHAPGVSPTPNGTEFPKIIPTGPALLAADIPAPPDKSDQIPKVGGAKEAGANQNDILKLVADCLAEDPNPNVDERLFLLRALDDLYHSLPAPTSDPKSIQDELARLRYSARRLESYIKTRQLGDRLGGLYAEYTAGLDAYTEFLADIQKIQRDGVAQAERDLAQSGFDALQRGVTVSGLTSDMGYSNNDAAGAGFLAVLVSAAFDTYQKNRELQEAQLRAIQRAARQVDDAFSSMQNHAEILASDLTTQLAWKKGEAGFDEEEENKAIRAMLAANDTNGAYELFTKRLGRRPRDPFLITRIFSLIANANASAGHRDEAIAFGLTIAGMARMVPAGEIYNNFRLRFLLEAGKIENSVFMSRHPGGGAFAGTSPSAGLAVMIWDRCLKYGSDPTGEIRENRAWALGAAGKINDAIVQANEVVKLRGNTLPFAYAYACLQCRAGNSESGLEWFRHAVGSVGCNWISRAKVDPDLEAIRVRFPAEFSKTIEVKWEWRVNFGVVNDDVLMTNTSAFALTNVILKTDMHQDEKSWTPELKASRIEPGQTLTWQNVISIPGSRLTKSTATMSCDQTADVPAPPPPPVEDRKPVEKVADAPVESELDRLRKAADAGDPKAMTRLAVMCLDGNGGVAKDEQLAFKLFQGAAQAGNGLAMNNLGAMYSKGQGGLTADDAEALRWYRKGAEAGNGLAMANLGWMYSGGRGGLHKDELQSVFWYQKSAAAGSSLGTYNLGVCYLTGTGGLARDEKKAAELFLKATEMNSDGGSAMAANNLGIMCENGGGGLSKDALEAAKWYRRGAESGCGLAMVNLGACYSQGRGVAHDDAEAVKWFKKGIEAGESRGFGSLGWMYANGLGVQRDDIEAVKWYRKGADAGDGMAMSCLAGMYADGRGLQQDDRQAVSWFQKAADAGDGGGMAGLATAYESGLGGLPRDHGLARQWMQRAAAAGVDQANQWLKDNP